MRLVAYLRVSTTEQAEHGLGLEVQEQAIREWAELHGHEIADVFVDAGVSGSNGLDDRDALLSAFAALRETEAEALIVYRLDRLARDLILQETLLAEAWSLGCEVLSTANGEANLRDDPDDPSRTLIRQVLGAVAQYERSMIVLRLRSGRRRKHERGGYAYGAPPYGWKAVSAELVPVPEEQAVIQRLRALRDQGATQRQMADALNADEVATRRPGRWHAATVGRVLRRADLEDAKRTTGPADG